MDLRPPTRPQPVQPQAPVQELPKNDPFKSDPPFTPSSSVKTKKPRGKAGKTILKVLMILILLGGVGYGVYYWQQQNVDKLTKENQALTAQVAASNTKITELEAGTKEETTTEAPTADELVVTSVTNYCQAGVDPTTKKALVYTQGTSGTDKKKVLYSTDKTFASVNAACTAAATTTDKAADFKVYYLKLVGTEWVVLTSGTTLDATVAKTYNIPATTDFK